MSDPFADYDFDLPQDRIAQFPADKRENSRLLHFHCDNDSVRHLRFTDFPGLLNAGDVLVLNDTRVIRARLFGNKETGGKVELFLLNPLSDGDCWEAMIRGSGKFREGSRLVFGKDVVKLIEPRDGHWKVEFMTDSPGEMMAKYGNVPLPPYIQREEGETTVGDSERYQTVYAKHDGAVAAPTAGLHFSDAILRQIEDAGVQVCTVTLHVGAGTFKPPTKEQFINRRLHKEKFEISEKTASILSKAKNEGRRIVAVGTTSVRTLETAVRTNGLCAQEGESQLFLAPGDRFEAVDAMLTNFHLPRSSLIMLVAAFIGDDWKKLYRTAIDGGYRFYSYGDAMFLER